MKQRIFIRICAVALSVSLVLSGITAFQLVRAFADEEGYAAEEGYGDDGLPDAEMDEPAGPAPEQSYYTPEPDPAPIPAPEEYVVPLPEPQEEDPAQQSDPFDYDLSATTNQINFGTIHAGDYSEAKQFTIINTGTTVFPLTWEEFDQYTAFEISMLSKDSTLGIGGSATFTIRPYHELSEGTYTARYTFFSANDYRRHHSATVNVSITVAKNEPYVTRVDVSPGSVSIPAGKTCSFNAVVSGGYDFTPGVVWSVTGAYSARTQIDSAGTLTVGADETASSLTVLAISKHNSMVYGAAAVSVTNVDYFISVRPEPADGGAVAGGGSVRAGGSCSLSASPNNNYSFAGWYEGNTLVSSDRRLSLSDIGRDMSLVARFSRGSCYIRTEVNNNYGGRVTQSQSVAYGGSVTITAEPNNGYIFGGFTENGRTLTTAAKLVLNNVTYDRRITANFFTQTFNVNTSVYPSDTGKVEGGGQYNRETDVTVKATPYNGYVFTGWSINGQVVSGSETYTIRDLRNDVNVVANFMKKNAVTYKITAVTANNGGVIVPGGENSIPAGASVTYNIVPQAGYRITAVAVDGVNLGAIASYTFNNVRETHSIAAAFDRIPAPASSGQPAPQAPAAPAQKTSQNDVQPAASQQTAPSQTSYNNETAARGALPQQSAGDVTIPQDISSLDGIVYEDDVYTPAYDMEPVVEGGVIINHNLSEAELRSIISNKEELPLLKEAFEEGTLRVTINNSYAADTQETAAELYYSEPSLLNFEEVAAENLTEDEKIAVLTGIPISFNVDILENTSRVSDDVKKALSRAVGYRPVSYFDFFILKTSRGVASVITNTETELEVVIPIPEKYRKEGRKFSVIRYHNGTLDILSNIGNDPSKITFRTDRFSQYAIAYEVISVNRLILRFFIIAGISLILAAICFTALIRYRRRERKRRKALAGD